MTEEIIIDKEDKEKKHRNNEIDCLHFSCRKGESGNVLFWCDFYDDHCDNYTGCYYRKYLRLEQENKILKSNTNVLNDYITKNEQLKTNIDSLVKINESLKQENRELKELNKTICEDCSKEIKVYWNALEEIKEIAFGGADGNDCTFCNRIFEKINEVL